MHHHRLPAGLPCGAGDLGLHVGGGHHHRLVAGEGPARPQRRQRRQERVRRRRRHLGRRLQQRRHHQIPGHIARAGMYHSATTHEGIAN